MASNNDDDAIEFELTDKVARIVNTAAAFDVEYLKKRGARKKTVKSVKRRIAEAKENVLRWKSSGDVAELSAAYLKKHGKRKLISDLGLTDVVFKKPRVDGGPNINLANSQSLTGVPVHSEVPVAMTTDDVVFSSVANEILVTPFDDYDKVLLKLARKLVNKTKRKKVSTRKGIAHWAVNFPQTMEAMDALLQILKGENVDGDLSDLPNTGRELLRVCNFFQ